MKQQNSVDVLFQKGVQQHRAGQLTKAEQAYRGVLRFAPSHSAALCNLGVIRKVQGDAAEALKLYERSLKSNPQDANTWSNYGNLLGDFGRWNDAVNACDKATACNPNSRDAWNNLANSLFNIGNVSRAETSALRALQIDPDFAEAWNTLGNALYPQGRFDEALNAYRKSFSIAPHFAQARSNVLFVANNHPDLSVDAIFSEYTAWASGFEVSVIPGKKLLETREKKHGRMRVAYLSPDLRHHSLRYFLLPLLEQHNKEEVELFLYSDSLVVDDWTRRYMSVADKFEAVRGLNDTELLAKIRADEIDVLVDLAGHTANHRLAVFARRAAPVQVSYLGYGYTTGLRNMDYFLADQKFVPEGAEKYFSERVWRLPRIQYVYRPDEVVPVAELPALRNGYITFGSFSRSVRFNHKVVRTWANILRSVEKSILRFNTRFLVEPSAQAVLVNAFTQHGISAERLNFDFESPPWRAYTEDVDIVLDPFPHNGGTTTFDALWMGCPVVSLAGHPALGRFGATILSAINHPDWVASNEDAYIEIAVKLAEDLDALSIVRAGLRAQVNASPIGDGLTLARSIESAFRGMWSQLYGD